ncbi:hypothetical protein [Nostoc sp.]|uniref:hypothetical protein n=1 Tax=Nostoc sp. TaxID=1180 RepID=UPI002FFC06A8
MPPINSRTFLADWLTVIGDRYSYNHLMIPTVLFMLDLNKIQEGAEIEVFFSGEYLPALISRGMVGYVPNNIPGKLPDFIAKMTKFDCSCNLWIDDYGTKWRFPS